jgi:hypothetical protein
MDRNTLECRNSWIGFGFVFSATPKRATPKSSAHGMKFGIPNLANSRILDDCAFLIYQASLLTWPSRAMVAPATLFPAMIRASPVSHFLPENRPAGAVPDVANAA